MRAAIAWCVLLSTVACQGAIDPAEPTVAAVPTLPNGPTTPLPPSDGEIDTDDAAAVLDCVATVKTGAVDCQSPSTAGSSAEPSDVFGGQSTLVNVVSSNASYVGTTFSIDVTLQNLSNEAIGTPNGTVADTNGIRIFFASGPTTTGGTGTVTVANADGTGTFTASNQPYYEYGQILAQNAVSAAKTWQFNVPNTVTGFTFRVYVSTEVQPLLVINEMLVNPGGTITDANGEWVELYNAGTRPVQMQGLVFTDSAASGRRPYNVFATSFIVQPGGYITLGVTTNTTDNGGVPIDYAYGLTNPLTGGLGHVVRQFARRVQDLPRVRHGHPDDRPHTIRERRDLGAEWHLARAQEPGARQLEHGRLELGRRVGDCGVWPWWARHAEGAELHLHAGPVPHAWAAAARHRCTSRTKADAAHARRASCTTHAAIGTVAVTVIAHVV